MEKYSSHPVKYRWKKSYTLLLVANGLYILMFYILMLIFS